jgi:hypothetical protein
MNKAYDGTLIPKLESFVHNYPFPDTLDKKTQAILEVIPMVKDLPHEYKDWAWALITESWDIHPPSEP